MSLWIGWRRLNTSDKFALGAFALALPIIDASLRLFGYRRTRGWLEALTQRHLKYPTAPQIARAQRLAALASIAGRKGAVRASCLRQALALHAWLRLRGLASEFRIGLSPPDGKGFNAHAWVELGGVALGEADPPSLTAFRPA